MSRPPRVADRKEATPQRGRRKKGAGAASSIPRPTADLSRGRPVRAEQCPLLEDKVDWYQRALACPAGIGRGAQAPTARPRAI